MVGLVKQVQKMEESSTSTLVLIIGISVTVILLFFLVLIVVLLMIRFRKRKGRNLDHIFAVADGRFIPVNTIDMRRRGSSPQYRTTAPPVLIEQHPNRPSLEPIYDSIVPRLATVSPMSPSYNARVSGISADLEDYPYAVVNKSRASHITREGNVDSMRSSVGVDLGGQYNKATWLLRD